jgi:hypothetical protein
MGMRPAQGGRGAHPQGLVEAERAQDAVFDLLVAGLTGGLLDDHVEQDVAGVGVLPALAGREVWRVGRGAGNELLGAVDVVALLVVLLRRGVSGQVVVDAAGVLEQLADGDPAAVVALPCTTPGSQWSTVLFKDSLPSASSHGDPDLATCHQRGQPGPAVAGRCD